MDLQQLRYFVAVADELNFSRASAQLGIAQPAVSRQVQSLEQGLGVQLFDRTKRQIELTAAGEALRIEARRILDQAQHAAEVTRRAARGETGRLTIAFVGSVMYGPVPRAMRTFRQRFPGVEFLLQEMETGLQGQAVLQRRIDLGLVRTKLEHAELSSEIVVHEEMIVALPAKHRLANRDELRVHDLADEPFLLFPRGRMAGFGDEIMAACAAAGFQPKVAQEVIELQTGISLVVAGFGVCIVPQAVSAQRRPGLVFRKFQKPAPRTSLVATYRSDNSAPALLEFLKLLRSVGTLS